MKSYARPNTNITGGAGTGGLLAAGTLNFNTDGTVASATTARLGGNLQPFRLGGGDRRGSQHINLDLNTGMTQFAKSFGVTSVTADGVPPGDLVGLVLEGDGMLTAQFSNGRARALYQIPLATFLNPNGLAADQGGAFRTTLESGPLQHQLVQRRRRRPDRFGCARSLQRRPRGGVHKPHHHAARLLCRLADHHHGRRNVGRAADDQAIGEA